MGTSAVSLMACFAAAVLLVFSMVELPSASAGAASHWCECVEYVKSYFGLHGAAGNAKDMGPFLSAHGFRKSAEPVPGAVMILQPGWYRSGSGTKFGHAAVIVSVHASGRSAWSVSVRGANQTGGQFTSQSCSDVSVKSFEPLPRTSRLVSYWVPPRHR